MKHPLTVVMSGVVRRPTVKVRAVMVGRQAHRSDRPPQRDRGKSTQRLQAVSQEQADEFRRLLEAERTLKEIESWREEIDSGWE